MCGIVSVYSPGEKRAMVSILADKMLATLKHRGPDDAGIWSDDGIALGNRRLATLDLSPTGHQPMFTDGHTDALTWNGECYGHQDLRVGFDHQWRGTSDTETVLALLARSHDPVWVCQRLRGMFGFAFWDGRRLVIARDRLGIKPLYYAHAYIPESCWFVASEVRAIRAVANCDLDWTSLAAYLRLGHIPSPRTAFQNVHELPPGCVGIIEQDSIKITPYWTLEGTRGFSQSAVCPRDSGDASSLSVPSLPTADERFRERSGRVKASRNSGPGLAAGPLSALFQDAVKSHLQSDVPVALLCGGGTDSRAIAKVAAESGAHLELLHILGDQRDSKGAMAISRRHNWPISFDLPKPTTEDLDQFFDRMDQPTVNGINLFFVARLAKKSGFKVVLSGLGGDELFQGYRTFRAIRYIRLLQRFASEHVAEAIAHLWPGRLADALVGERTFAAAYGAARGLFSKTESIAVTRGPLQDACRTLDLDALLPDTTDMRAMELSSYLRSQLLRDADTFSMAHSVELRVPFLDTAFVESALDHPINRRQFCRALGLPAPGRKRGFSLPISAWLKEPWRAEVRPFPELFNLNLAVLVSERVHWSRPWALLVLGRWWEKNT